MTIGTIDESQRKAATVVGFAYLFALPPAIFAEFYVRTQLIAFDNAAQTAQNIMAHERLFRLGTASNITVFAVDGFLAPAEGITTLSRAAPDGVAGQHSHVPFLRSDRYLQLAGFSTEPLTGYYQWLPALVFQVVLALWLLIKGVATAATR
jgi:Domain of unknown function (DUF4386)